MFSTGQWMCWPCADGGEADDAAATDGGWPAVAWAGGELHGNNTHANTEIFIFKHNQFFTVVLVDCCRITWKTPLREILVFFNLFYLFTCPNLDWRLVQDVPCLSCNVRAKWGSTPLPSSVVVLIIFYLFDRIEQLLSPWPKVDSVLRKK